MEQRKSVNGKDCVSKQSKWAAMYSFVSYCISNMNRYMRREMFVEDVNIENKAC